jgi:hypothetical protein
MDSDTDYRCWEIMNCDNLDCPARHEPETPCWEISKGGDSYHNVTEIRCIHYKFSKIKKSYKSERFLGRYWNPPSEMYFVIQIYFLKRRGQKWPRFFSIIKELLGFQ